MILIEDIHRNRHVSENLSNANQSKRSQQKIVLARFEVKARTTSVHRGAYPSQQPNLLVTGLDTFRIRKLCEDRVLKDVTSRRNAPALA